MAAAIAPIPRTLSHKACIGYTSLWVGIEPTILVFDEQILIALVMDENPDTIRSRR